MARAAVLGRLSAPLAWRRAEVVSRRRETPRVTTLGLEVPGWSGHVPGQHVDVRLTAPDGYTATRSYSIASAPRPDVLELGVERLEDGEVSPYLADEVEGGDAFEVLGPLGGWFVWEPRLGGPLQLVGGGSGVVPLMSILRHRAEEDGAPDTRLLLSARTLADVIYRDELEATAAADPSLSVVHTLTRARPEGWRGYARRVDRALLAEAAWPAEADPLTYVCGPTGFVEAVAAALVELGHDPGRIRTERFGGTG